LQIVRRMIWAQVCFLDGGSTLGATLEEFYLRFHIQARPHKEPVIDAKGLDDVNRHHVAPGWKWRYLRGIQCILLATRGLVRPNPDFIRGAFGGTYEVFLEILSMPDRYIIYRSHYGRDGATGWQQEYRRLNKARLSILT